MFPINGTPRRLLSGSGIETRNFKLFLATTTDCLRYRPHSGVVEGSVYHAVVGN